MASLCAAMNELRALRRTIGLGQREFAALLSIPLETFRPWDSGRRVVAAAVLQRARDAVAHHQRQQMLLPLDQLAKEFHVHIRTFQAAVRTGRLAAHFSVKSVFGRPRRLATRAAAAQFMTSHYRRFSGQAICPAPLPTVPHDFPRQLRALRRRLRLTQAGLARCIGGAGKAVIYQWESRKRTPSPVLWQRVLRLERGARRRAERRSTDAPSSVMRSMVRRDRQRDADFALDLVLTDPGNAQYTQPDQAGVIRPMIR
jgi:DNA-binding transcriptional regulator YiaG